MTTTAFDDQFTPATQTVEPVRQPYDTVAILRRNIADMEVALRTQTERAEAAEAELANLAQQKPVAWRHENGNIFLPWQKDLIVTGAVFSPLFAAPVPAPHPGATHCDDCGLTWLDDGLNPLWCPYCKARAPAPAVPDDSVILDWLEMQRVDVASVVGHRPQYGFLSVGASGKSDLRSKVRALLQSAEAQASDKWQLTPAPTHPADRNAGEVRHD